MIKLLVWNNAWGFKAYSHPGHAALAITDGSKVEHYVSWWPEDVDKDEDKRRGYQRGGTNTILNDYHMEMGDNARARLRTGAVPRAGQTKNENIVEDGFTVHNQYAQWVKQPDETLTIPSVDDRSNPERASIGLSEKNIEDWWTLFSEKRVGYFNQRYKMISNEYNCASVVMMALVAGGCDLFMKHDRASIYYTPNQLMSYGHRLSDRIHEINEQAQMVNASLLANHARVSPDSRSQFGSCNPDSTGDIWSATAWRMESAVRIGRRKEQIAQIDRLIADYWAAGPVWNEANKVEKAVKLRDILRQVQSHIVEKPNSDRRESVLKLGSQCILVLKDRAENKDEWKTMIKQNVGVNF